MTKYLVIFLTMAMLISISASLPDNAFSIDMVQKIGDICPNKYISEGNYCVPLSGAKEVVAKIGSRCPLGFSPDGDYCYRVQIRPSKVIPKVGNQCPKDYSSDGAYCVSLK
jgi:hypothetical protein